MSKPLALRAAYSHLDVDDADRVHEIVSARGAYARFKDLLGDRGRLEHWSEFETQSQREALRDWLESAGIQFVDRE